MQPASSSAVTVKYVCTGGMVGRTPPARWSYWRPSQAATPMKAPVSTGYSTAWSTYGVAPTFSFSSKNSGTTSE